MPLHIALAALRAAVFSVASVVSRTSGTPTFEGLAWGATPASVRALLSARGYRVIAVEEHGDLQFSGSNRGTVTLVHASFASAGLAKTQALWVTEDRKAIAFHRAMVRTLAARHGAPSGEDERYDWPCPDDESRRNALRSGNGQLAAVWAWPAAGDATAGVAVHVTERLTVRVVYESGAWAAESARRRGERPDAHDGEPDLGADAVTA